MPSFPTAKLPVLSNDTKISGLLNISGVCPEISSICPEIRIGDKDGAIFLSYDTKISRLLKVSCVCPEIYGVCLKIFRLVQILGRCLEIFSMCPEILIIQKDYICLLSYNPTNSRLLRVSAVCPEVSGIC